MDRRTLLRNLLAVLPAGFILPSALTGCRDDDFIPENPFSGSVLIIGAGAAGIYAANLLKKYGVSVTIIEASNRTGGRIVADTTFADIPVELGAEFIHGNRSLLVDLIKFVAPERLVPMPGNDVYWLESQLRNENYLKESTALEGEGATLFQLLDSLATYPGENMTVTEYLTDFPLDPRFIGIANALIGNEYGSDNDRVGMLALKEAEAGYSSGSEELILNSGSFWNIFEKAFKAEIDAVILSKPVTAVNYTGSKPIVTAGGETFSADRVLVTVPLGVLKTGSISFDPALPADKVEAISEIGMGIGLKIILKFSSAFWEAGTASIIGGDKVPEYWVSSAGKNGSQVLLTAFVMGARAEYLAGLSEDAMKAEILTELSLFYGAANVTGRYISLKMKNWAEEPFTKGAYSFPTRTSAGKPAILAKAVSGKVFFAGEATNFNGHQATVHGAMESAFRAVKELLES